MCCWELFINFILSSFRFFHWRVCESGAGWRWVMAWLRKWKATWRTARRARRPFRGSLLVVTNYGIKYEEVSPFSIPPSVLPFVLRSLASKTPAPCWSPTSRTAPSGHLPVRAPPRLGTSPSGHDPAPPRAATTRFGLHPVRTCPTAERRKVR